MISSELLTKLQDKDHDLSLLCGAVQAKSVTGDEANFVSYLKNILEQQGFEPQQREFLPGRPNLWGQRKGAKAGKRLLFMGHTDTVHVNGWAQRWRGDHREDPCSGVVVDGKLWGRGSVDLKGGICAALAAVDLLDKAGVNLAGELAFAFVGDEESGEPGTGVSAGVSDYTRMVVQGEIAKPDFAIYVEPTELAVYTSQIGFFIADIEVTGKAAYFGKPEMGVDAIKAMHKIQSAIWKYSAELEALEKHPLVGRSGALITHLSGGGYISVPEKCNMSLIRKLRPGESLDDSVIAFEDVINSAELAAGINVQFSYPAGRDHRHGGTPAEIDPSLPEVGMLREAIGDVSGKLGEIGGAPYWSEAPFLIKQIGCPAVYCAPGDISVAHTLEEHIEVKQYLAAVRTFALFIHRYLHM